MRPLSVASAAVLLLCCAAPVLAEEPAVPAVPPLAPAIQSSHTAVPELAAIAGVALLGISDHWVWRQATGAGGTGGQRLADFVQPIGTPAVVLPPLVLGYAAGALFDRPGLSRASVRIAGAIGLAGVTTEALKLTVGRSRPFQVLNGDPDEMRMFSGGSSFPSGHATIAFAAATALDRETDSRWVPWLAYPIAGLVGWSRIHDEKHWLSDVAAGAAVGYFAANHAENFMRSSDPIGRRLSPILQVGRGMMVGARYRF